LLLFKTLKIIGDEIELVQVFSRKANTLVNLLDADLVTTDIAALLDADLYIIAVSDMRDTVAAELPLKPISCHTSGSMGLDVLHNNNRRGVSSAANLTKKQASRF
jgi:hypothetical protein